MLKTREFLLFSVITILFNNLSFIKARKENYFILNWGQKNFPLWFLNGEQFFIDNKCKYKNCYVTSNKTYFKDKKMFDAIVFDAADLKHVREKKNLPSGKYRSKTQKYIFTSVESEDYYPLCEPFYDKFFNWTWTYKLDSTISRSYITVFDKKNQIVGPKANKKWRKDMDPIDQILKEELQYKTRLAAWFVSKCKSKGRREVFVSELQKTLKRLGDEAIDVFGKCGWYDCPDKDQNCARMLKRDYMFYLAFENSLSQDYVTEKLMRALDNYNIPVVYGGADYTRFLPPGSYLNARELGPENLARKMLEIANNLTSFYDFFRWRNHFVFKDTTDNLSLCNLCTMMNNDKMLRQKSVKRYFVNWWNDGLCEEFNEKRKKHG